MILYRIGFSVLTISLLIVRPGLLFTIPFGRPSRQLSRSLSRHSCFGKSSFKEQRPRTAILAEISNKPGSLFNLLQLFLKFGISLTRIESRPYPSDRSKFKIYIDFEDTHGEQAVENLLKALGDHCGYVFILDGKQVPWFPRHISDLDLVANRTLGAGLELESDHPGFNDQQYRQRRDYLATVASSHSHGKELPWIDYTNSEIATWGKVYSALEDLHKKYACKEYLNSLELMKTHCNFGPDSIPQANDISEFLKRQTGFTLRPVAGLLSSRMFLYGLAFRTFFSTQYIRHPSRPFYTPEPDICHELIGHVPMFVDPDFADFSQEIGLASLGASDGDIEKLASCYWFSVEFGLLKGDDGQPKAYGAGLLSSIGELEYACADARRLADCRSRENPDHSTVAHQESFMAYKNITSFSVSLREGPSRQPRVDTENTTTPLLSGVKETGTVRADRQPVLLPWDPEVASHTKYPITSYQPKYFIAESLSDAKEKMRRFCEDLKRPFYAHYDSVTQSIWVDRAVRPEPPKESQQ